VRTPGNKRTKHHRFSADQSSQPTAVATADLTAQTTAIEETLMFKPRRVSPHSMQRALFTLVEE
jgi:hypothetical protein